MMRFLWPLLFLVICGPVAWLVFGGSLSWFEPPRNLAQPASVRSGSIELAWLHPTTNSSTWERFVTGIVRAQMRYPDLIVDDSRAFEDSSTAIPELVLGWPGIEQKIYIRWYKLRSDVDTKAWVQALLQRNPAPLAFIGGGSSDRAAELAKELSEQTQGQADPPLLLITTASADDVQDPRTKHPKQLTQLYPNRTFRFCFRNSQMAEAVMDYVWQQPNLSPVQQGKKPRIFSVFWGDDPYSDDLRNQFTTAIKSHDENSQSELLGPYEIPFSVGGFLKANEHETRTGIAIAQKLQEEPDQRALLVLPAVTQPARRLLRSILENNPQASEQLVVVTGDGIPINAILRDGPFSWPLGELRVPLVLFMHNDPLAWDDESTLIPPTNYELTRPTSTEDVMHFTEMAEVLLKAFGISDNEVPLVQFETSPEIVAKKLRASQPVFFDASGERLSGTREFVIVVKPDRSLNSISVGQLSVWRRDQRTGWKLIRDRVDIPRVPESDKKP